MGSYLSAPVKEKESERGVTTQGYAFGVSSMQGWRRTQEDAHIVASLDCDTAVFGVFDGHGGREVSAFSKLHFATTLRRQPAFEAALPQALIGAFHGVDELLEDKNNLEEINSLKHRPAGTPPSTAASAGGGEAQLRSALTNAMSSEDDRDGAPGEKKVPITGAVDMLHKLMMLKKMKAMSSDSADGAVGSGEESSEATGNGDGGAGASEANGANGANGAEAPCPPAPRARASVPSPRRQ